MVFAIECIAACVLFTLALEAVSAGRREGLSQRLPTRCDG